MGILNRIVLILILLAAAGAAVLSYFLFEKRNQMLQGWEQMAKEIRVAAENMDKGSGTKVAEALSPENLNHRNSLADIGTKLKNLSDGAKKLVQQRDDLAGTVQKLAAAVEVTSVDAKQLCAVDSYAAHSAQTLNSVQEIRRRNDAILNSFIGLGGKLGVADSASAIKADSGAAYSAKLGTAISKKNNRITLYETSLRSISSTVGASAFNNAEDKYSTSAGAAVAGVSTMKNTLSKTKSELASANNKIKGLESEKTSLQKQIDTCKEEISKQEEIVKELKHKLNPTGDPELDKFLYGKKDNAYFRNLYSLVRCNVKKVDHEWNFVVLDLGARQNVKQTFAGKVFTTMLTIPSGKAMSVVRDLGSSRPKFIGRIMITEIHPDYAVANIETASQKGTIQEGDTVLFLNDDLDALLASFNPETASF